MFGGVTGSVKMGRVIPHGTLRGGVGPRQSAVLFCVDQDFPIGSLSSFYLSRYGFVKFNEQRGSRSIAAYFLESGRGCP